MASTPTQNDLTAVLARLADRLDSLEERLDRIEIGSGTIRSAATMRDPSPTPKPTKGKGRAVAPNTPSKAKPAKKERPTRKAATLPNPVPLHLAQTFSTEGKADRHLVTVVIPDTTAQHVIGQGGKGLKQVHDISGARVNAYTLASGPSDERHVSIRGTDLQIGDALVVLGKRIARKKVRPPKAKKTSPTADSSTAAPLLPTYQQSSTLSHHFVSTQRSGPSTEPYIAEVPTGEHDESPVTPFAPTVQMASPSPSSTPIVPSVTMGSPSSSPSTGQLTPMQIDALRERSTLTGLRIAQLRGSDPSERVRPGRGINTARRSRPSPSGNQGRG